MIVKGTDRIVSDLSLRSLKPVRPAPLQDMGHAARHLELSGSKLAELPADVGSLGALRALEVQYCDLVALPESIGELRLLRSLCAAVLFLGIFIESLVF